MKISDPLRFQLKVLKGKLTLKKMSSTQKIAKPLILLQNKEHKILLDILTLN